MLLVRGPGEARTTERGDQHAGAHARRESGVLPRLCPARRTVRGAAPLSGCGRCLRPGAGREQPCGPRRPPAPPRSSTRANRREARDLLQADIAKKTAPDAALAVHARAVAAAAQGLRRRVGHRTEVEDRLSERLARRYTSRRSSSTIAAERTRQSPRSGAREAVAGRCVARARVREPAREGRAARRTPNVRSATCSRRIRSTRTRSTHSATCWPITVSGSMKPSTSCSAR